MLRSQKQVRFIIGAALPEDVARAALFLPTEDAGFATGKELPVDGGVLEVSDQ